MTFFSIATSYCMYNGVHNNTKFLLKNKTSAIVPEYLAQTLGCMRELICIFLFEREML